MTRLNVIFHCLAQCLARCLAVGLVAASGTCAWAQDPGKPVERRTQLEKVEATVVAINPDTREVTLSGPQGTAGIVVGPEAKNLDKVHVGDKVVVSYYEGVAVQMSKGGAKAQDSSVSEFVKPAAGGKKPGGEVGGSVTTTVTIEAVDTKSNTVTFKRPDGAVRTISVEAPDMQQFIRTLKRGDAVDVTYTESIAVDVVPAKG
jgi:hypothetical protein